MVIVVTLHTLVPMYKSFVWVLVSAWIIDEKTTPCTTKVPITKASTLDVVNFLKERRAGLLNKSYWFYFILQSCNTFNSIVI